jgi:phosphate transport system protein
MIEMGALIERSITLAIKALIEQDVELAELIVSYDDEIDQKEREIESMCLKLLMQQQPVARDLRLISAALKMITDMERIGDQATDISQITIYLSKEPYIKKLVHLPQMAEATIKMVTDSINAFVNKDLELAKSIHDQDDVVDDLFRTIKSELIDLIHENISNGQQALDLLMIAKYFERIGDHAVNIGEWVTFSLTGQHKNDRVI